MKFRHLAPILVAPVVLGAAARRASISTPRTPAQPAPSVVATPRHLPARESLPPLARSILSQRMEKHAFEMQDLVWSVVFLEHDGTREIADEIATEPKIARPLPGAGADDLSSQLPAKFFDMQDALQARAKDLATAASHWDDEEVAKAYGRLSETCVACHAAYLEEER